MNTKFRIAIMSQMMLLAAFGAMAEDTASKRVQNTNGNPSPSAAASQIDTYLFQDEQVNIRPGDQDVLVLRANQKILLNRFVTRTFPIRNVSVRELRGIFRDITAKEGGRAEVIRDKVNGEYYLQVIVPEWMVPFIERVVPIVDQEWLTQNDDGSKKVYYAAQHRPIADVDRIVQQFASGDARRSDIDPVNNAVMHTNEPYRADKYVKAAKMVDVPEHQARFHIKVYEVNVNNDLRLGLDYIAWKNGPGRNLFEFGFAGTKARQTFKNVSGFADPLFPQGVSPTGSTIHLDAKSRTRFGSVNYLMTAAYLDFLASKGKAKTLAEGDIQVKSGSIGSFGATEPIVSFAVLPDDPGLLGTIPVRVVDIEGDGDEDTGDRAIFNRTLRRRAAGEVGLVMEINPVILMESMEVEVFAEVSSVTGYTPQGLPIINTSEVETKVRLRDGDIFLLGGLTRQEKIQSKQGMPFLSSIPVLGYLFGGENNISRETQIVIVIEVNSETGGESKLADPPEIQTIANQVTGEAVPEIPKNAFGFDMWLLGPTSGPSG